MAIKILLIGTGNMAHLRAEAFKGTGVEIVGVLSGKKASAQNFCMGREINVFGSLEELEEILTDTNPDAILIELPHAPQDQIVQKLLAKNIPLMIGGPLASNIEMGEKIIDSQLLVETGYEGRYNPIWITAKNLLPTIGQVTNIKTNAFWVPPKNSWYWDEALSGGMPITHMSYCFINLIRFLLEMPIKQVTATGIETEKISDGEINLQSCTANIIYASGEETVNCNVEAGYLREGLPGPWQILIQAEYGYLKIIPEDNSLGRLFIANKASEMKEVQVNRRTDPFHVQAQMLVDVLKGSNSADLKNPASDSLHDLYAALAITKSIELGATIPFVDGKPIMPKQDFILQFK